MTYNFILHTCLLSYLGVVSGVLFGQESQTGNQNFDDRFGGTRKGVKRRASECDFEEIMVPPKRISPFFNTPKERKEERRKILKISVQKMKCIVNAELCLRRSVLINNTMKRMKYELRKDTNLKRKKPLLGNGMLNNDCLSDSYLVDDPFLSGIHEKITDDMTDILMSNLEKKLGARISSLSNNENNSSDGANNLSNDDNTTKHSSNSPISTTLQTSANNSVENLAMDCDTKPDNVSTIDQCASRGCNDVETLPEMTETSSFVSKSSAAVTGNGQCTDKNETDSETTKVHDTDVPLNSTETIEDTIPHTVG